MRITSFFIDNFARFVVGAPYKQIKELVAAMESDDKSGSEKRRAVLDAVESLGFAIGGWLLNLAVELAVASQRSR